MTLRYKISFTSNHLRILSCGGVNTNGDSDSPELFLSG